jgi:predicted NAD/FAD-binding protein
LHVAQFSAFLRELDVKTIPTDMSFGVSTNGGALEWGSYSIRSFVQNFHLLFSFWFWRLLFEVVRFTLFAEDILYEDQPTHCDEKESEHLLQDVPAQASHLESIGDYLKRKGYSYQFMTYFIIPMMAAPWCIDPDEFARTFPAKTLIQFM